MARPEILNRAVSLASGVASGIATGAGGAVLHRLQHVRLPDIGGASATDDPERSARRWRAVTVLCSPDRLGNGDPPPPPLDRLAGRIEVRVRPAPADKGTELAARFRRPAGEDLGELRSALRQAKQLIEAGEVLRVEPAPHGTRKATLRGALVEGVAERAPKEGLL